MKRIYICIMAAVSVMAAASCQKLEVESVVDPRFEPVGEGVELNNVPFEVKITEKRMCKVIHWSFDAAKGKFVPDCSKVGDLAITDWNEVSVDVVSDSPDFQGVKVKSEGGGIIVGYDPKNGADSLKHFTLKRNKDNKESVKDNIVTFYIGETPDSGRKIVLDNVEAAEYIDITGVRIKLKTLPAYELSSTKFIITRTDTTIPKGHPCYYDIDEVFEPGWGYSENEWCKGSRRFNAADISEDHGPFAGQKVCPIQVTVVEPVPANTSWRIVDITCATRSDNIENALLDAYPELDWISEECFPENHEGYRLYGLDWDDICGKSILLPGCVFEVAAYVKPEKDPETIGGWRKTYEKTSDMHFLNGIRPNWKTVCFYSIRSFDFD